MQTERVPLSAVNESLMVSSMLRCTLFGGKPSVQDVHVGAACVMTAGSTSQGLQDTVLLATFSAAGLT